MKVFMLLMFLHLSAVNPLITVHLTGINTVDQGLAQLNKAFPDWNANYKENEFDCSEMSSLVYQYFKDCGLKPELKCGWAQNIWGYRGIVGHCWVVCQGKVIECTKLQIYPAYMYKDFKPEVLPDYMVKTEYDWWDSKYIIGKERSF
jgi:hypothetical protein